MLGWLLLSIGLWAVLAGGVWALLFARGEREARPIDAAGGE